MSSAADFRIGGTAVSDASMGASSTEKIPFDIDVALERINKAVEPYPKAALFELFGDGYTSPFEQLVACMISIRTRDETTLPVALRLFARARTPAEVLALPIEELDDLIRESAFHAAKAAQIHAIAERSVAEFGGSLPCDFVTLVSLPGVGPKCANLVLGIACGQPRIGVDIHVHRVTNRWGIVETTSPEATLVALEEMLPTRHWIEINRLLVPFGKHICTGTRPWCSVCPVLDMCRQVGVTNCR
ncbi:MAG: lyase [Chloroflexi bacterium]|nr:lyase [Chloroflexota bacterium]